MLTPRTRFVTASDGARIAYQVVGEGERDVSFVGDWLSSVDLVWEHPASARFLDSLADLGRLILLDKRGSGGSDPTTFARGGVGDAIEQGASDLLTVLDEIGSAEVDLVTASTGLWPVVMLSATAPSRVRRLVALDPPLRILEADDYACGLSREELAAVIDNIDRHWGEGTSLLYYAPDRWDDTALREWLGRYERLATTRTFMKEAWTNAAEVDLRAVLPLVQAETLVLSHLDNPLMNSDQGRYMAQTMPAARFVGLEGSNLFPWDDENVIAHIEDFLGGSSHAHREAHRVLATIVFTDIVGSTTRLVNAGDERWRHLLDDHDRLGANLIERFRGRVVKRTGDGLLAVFDGPARAVRCAKALTEEGRRRLGVELRAGVHTGEVETRGDDIGGLSVHIAARAMDLARGGEIVATRTVKDLTAGSGLNFHAIGTHTLKGVPEPWDLYAVDG